MDALTVTYKKCKIETMEVSFCKVGNKDSGFQQLACCRLLNKAMMPQNQAGCQWKFIKPRVCSK
jgi:hypothetical protein